ncbi:MAG: DNA alkylation repair protein [Legionella sp.]|nr:MAG: DNA alkylation repair protein [Legionella sp.]PJD97410.1 MAG: DNA alkylation repair protein [Legionella sp.]
MMQDLILRELQPYAIPLAKRKAIFFKTGPGDYAEHDQFLGVPTPQLRKLAKRHQQLALDQLAELLTSPINEIRLLASMILVKRYQKSDLATQEAVFQLYCSHRQYINNWNLVDATAHHIVGAHLHQQDKSFLLELASSNVLWDRRIAMVSTWYFIRHHEFEWTISLAKKLLADKQDLIHKAVGWMLREMGKRDLASLLEFLNQYRQQMPRTTLRYAIEKLPLACRQEYLRQ